MLPYTELPRDFSKICLGSVIVKSMFTPHDDEHITNLPLIGAGSLLSPIMKNCGSKVFISTALHNVLKLGNSLVKLEVQFGKQAAHPLFVLCGKIVSHGRPLFPLKCYPNEDWAILEILEKTSGEIFEMFIDHHDYTFVPSFMIPRPSKVEKTILNDRYSLALFSFLLHHYGPTSEDIEVLKRQGHHDIPLLKEQIMEWIETGVMYGSFGYGTKISKQTLLHSVGTLSACSGAMVIGVDLPLGKDMVIFKDHLKSVSFNKINAIGIHVGYGEDQQHNVLCPVSVWFENYYRIVYPEICNYLTNDDKRRIQKEAIFMQRLDKYQRHKMMTLAFCDVKIICQEKSNSREDGACCKIV
ncbi:predicted protein [Naegleria gruberi]|uniref:Predicted protein n=1 Tax=Naegleria gruberi TaxID=5762 RepID=D2VNU0_NAEGR|nr:uncharacterized protein NAEGRDRAFT_80674 [Naegleria gruberi]EFC41474.1 predicted protein [Naegleria gruberi]|eukprot:XP_002674218.1 predicted protein [Naegleria gruberi strain NEG-M]